MKLKLIVIIKVFFIVMTNLNSYVTFAQSMSEIPWGKRTSDQKFFESSYEDEFTYKHKKHFYKDPFIWVVSKEFAERFGMPKEWIDSGLKGALAVAWRTTTIGKTMCGFGSEEKCWPAFTCQMDIYVDSKAPIPWRYNDVERDFFWQGLTSLDYVPRRRDATRRIQYTDGFTNAKGLPFLSGRLKYPFGSTDGNASMDVVYFDRKYANDISLIGFVNACPTKANYKGPMIVQMFSDEEEKRTQGRIQNYAHTIEFPESFLEKVRTVYVPQSEEVTKNNQIKQDVFKKFVILPPKTGLHSEPLNLRFGD